MPRYRMLTRDELSKEKELDARDKAQRLATVHAELVQKGLPPNVVEEIVKSIAGAASSESDGQCSGLARLLTGIFEGGQ